MGNTEYSMTTFPEKTRVEVTWDAKGKAFDYQVVNVGFKGWTGDYTQYEWTVFRGRCSTEGACDLAARLIASYGGTVTLNGKPFATDAFLNKRGRGCKRAFESQLRPVKG